MDVSELKHEIVLDNRLWLVRWYRWLYGKRAKMDFCHLFWGTLLSLVPAVIIATALPVILPTMLGVRFLRAHPPTWIAGGARLSLRAAGTLLAWVIFGPTEKIHDRLVTAVAQEQDLRAAELARRREQYQRLLEDRARLDATRGWYSVGPALPPRKKVVVRRATDFWAPLWEPVQRRRSLARRAADTLSGKVRLTVFALVRAAVVSAALFWLGAEVAFDVVVTIVVLMAGLATWPVRTTWSRGAVPAGKAAARAAQRAALRALNAVADGMPRVIMAASAASHRLALPFVVLRRALRPVLRPVGKLLYWTFVCVSALTTAVGVVGFIGGLVIAALAVPAVVLVSAGATLPVAIPVLVLWLSWRVTPLAVRRLLRKLVTLVAQGIAVTLAASALALYDHLLAPPARLGRRAATRRETPYAILTTAVLVAAVGDYSGGDSRHAWAYALTGGLVAGSLLWLVRRPVLNLLEVVGIAVVSAVGKFLVWIVLDLLFGASLVVGETAAKQAKRTGVSSWQVLRWGYRAVKTNTCPRIVVHDTEEPR